MRTTQVTSKKQTDPISVAIAMSHQTAWALVPSPVKQGSAGVLKPQIAGRYLAR